MPSLPKEIQLTWTWREQGSRGLALGWGEWSQGANSALEFWGCRLLSGCSPFTPEWGDGSCSREEGAPGGCQHPGLSA